jgi:hypothetical protein
MQRASRHHQVRLRAERHEQNGHQPRREVVCDQRCRHHHARSRGKVVTISSTTTKKSDWLIIWLIDLSLGSTPSCQVASPRIGHAGERGGRWHQLDNCFCWSALTKRPRTFEHGKFFFF